MKTYICTKMIHAVPVKMVNGIHWPDGLPLPDVPEIPVIPETVGCCNLKVEHLTIEDGYMFTNSADDKYPQYMSAADFETMCRPAEAMTFGDALDAMKRGERVARKNWNGKGMYVFLAHEPDFVTDADLSAFDQLDVEVSDMMVLKTAQDTFQPGWLATQSDMLADDWYIVE